MISWSSNSVPYAIKFDDHYYCLQNGKEESQYIFLEQNELPQAWSERDIFHIGELGFGTGLNFLNTLALWKRTATREQKLHYSAFERWPLNPNQIRQALSVWPELSAELDQFLNAYVLQDGQGKLQLCFDSATVVLFIGQALELIDELPASVNAWYLDGFAPDKNPDLWSEQMLEAVARHSAPRATFATFTAAGHVRRKLESCGFMVEKFSGFGNKRESLRGFLC